MMLAYQFPAWAVMWLAALALYGSAKCATLAAGHVRGVSVGRRVAYLLLFPGMNATEFCVSQSEASRPLFAGVRYAANVLVGVFLLWGVARQVPAEHPLVQGWIGMIGLVQLLHFGVLQLVSLGWRAAGFDAPPLMREPIRSASVTEFWSVRWNTAYRQLSHQWVFKPLLRCIGPRAAVLATFAVSGLVHDLVISVPAGGGFGLPTAYFVIQGVGVLFERSQVGRRLLRRRLLGRCFAIAVVVLPVPLLFHPVFVLRVIVQFMGAIGALPREIYS